MTDINRKRHLDSEFQSEAKRTKIVSETMIEKKNPSLHQEDTFTFLPFHLSILKSLYTDSNNRNQESLWRDISSFLTHRRSLLEKHSTSVHLSELIQEVKKVSEEASSVKYKTTSMNMIEPVQNTNTVLSFITQSQQAQTFALTSPFKTEIQEQIFSPYLYSYSFQKHAIVRPQGHPQQHNYLNTAMRSFGSHRRPSPRLPSSTSTTIQSMNLIMAALGAQHFTSLKELEQSSEPFLPLFHRVKDELDRINLQWKEWKSKEEEMKNSMISENVTSCSTISVDDILNLAEQIEDEQDKDRMNDKAILLCKRGLWKALGHSLESVLFHQQKGS